MARNNEIRLKLRPDELERIKRKADKLGLTISAFLRLLGLSAEIENSYKNPPKLQ